MATTKQGKRVLESREPQLVEMGPKLALVLKGNKSSETISQLLCDLHRLTASHSMLQSRRHQDLYPFDNAEGVSHLCSKWDAPLMVVGSSSKKRPDNLIFVRLFAGEILDLAEFQVLSFKPITSFPGLAPAAAQRPLLLFNGELFETDKEFERIKNLCVDLFGGRSMKSVDVTGLEHVIAFSATAEKQIHIRCYTLGKEQGELKETGPRVTLALRRQKPADEHRFQTSLKRPRPKPLQKNVGKGPMGERLGRIYTNPEDLNKLQLKKRRKLKESRD
jgi:ribosome production factor 2